MFVDTNTGSFTLALDWMVAGPNTSQCSVIRLGYQQGTPARATRGLAAIASMAPCGSEICDSELANYPISEGDENALRNRGTVGEVDDLTVNDSHQKHEKWGLPAEYSTKRIDNLSTHINQRLASTD